MTQQATPDTNSTPQQATQVPTEAERIAAIEAKFATQGPPKELLDLDSAAEDDGEEAAVDTPAETPEAKATKVKPLAIAEPDDAEDPDLDKALLAQREIVRQRRERSRQQAEFEAQQAQFYREQQETQQRMQQLQPFLEQIKTPAGVLEWFEQQGGNPTALIEYIRKAEDPSFRAAQDAKKELNPFRKELDETKAQLAAIQQAQLIAEASRALDSRVTELAGSEKYAKHVQHAAAMAKTDHDYFLEACDRAATQLQERRDSFGRPLPYDYDDVIIEVEKRFRREATRYGASQPPGAETTSQPATPATKPKNGKAPPKNITQQAAGGRTVMAEQEDFSLLSPKERAARLEQRYRALERAK